MVLVRAVVLSGANGSARQGEDLSTGQAAERAVRWSLAGPSPCSSVPAYLSARTSLVIARNAIFAYCTLGTYIVTYCDHIQ